MPEGANVEIAHSLTEEHHGEARAHEGWHRVLDVFEVFLLAVVAIATAWLAAHEAGNDSLQNLYRKWMTHDYQVAFDAWLTTDPFNNPNAPVGPVAMPEYKNPYADRATHLNDEASAIFDEGTEARETGEKYVRNTVLFAMVLFLVAIAQRFKDRTLRTAVNVIAVGVLTFALVSILTLPRIT